MPFRICRWSSFGRPVPGFSGGSSGSSRCHCSSVKSPRLMALRWKFRPETSAVCRHGLVKKHADATDRLLTAYAEAGEGVSVGVAAYDVKIGSSPSSGTIADGVLRTVNRQI